MDAFLEMYRAATPLIQSGDLHIEHQSNDYRQPLLVLSCETLLIKLTAWPDNICVYIRNRRDDHSQWYELKSVIRAIGKVRPDWIATPLPEPDDFLWAAATEIGDCLVQNFSVLKRFGEKEFPPLDGLSPEY